MAQATKHSIPIVQPEYTITLELTQAEAEALRSYLGNVGGAAYVCGPLYDIRQALREQGVNCDDGEYWTVMDPRSMTSLSANKVVEPEPVRQWGVKHSSLLVSKWDTEEEARESAETCNLFAMIGCKVVTRLPDGEWELAE